MSTASVDVAAAFGTPPPPEHVVQFYEGDDFLVDSVARFIGAALGGGEAALVIATASHRRQVEAQLEARGLALALARDEGRLVTLDAAETLARIVVDGWPDAARFAAVTEPLVDRLTGGGRTRLCAFGEMVALLCAAGDRGAAIRLEALWNELARRRPFALLCAYPIDAFGNGPAVAPFLDICAAHAEIVPAESYTTLTDPLDRRRMVTQLQQKARVLESEVAFRLEIEDALRDRDETLRALVAASPLPIVVVAADATVRLWNPAAERVFGWAEGEVIGRAIPIVPPEKQEEAARLREALFGGVNRSGIETYRTKRDGMRIDVVISAAPLSDPQGAVRAIVLLFEDVTDRNRIEDARQRVFGELQTLYRMGRVLSGELDLDRLRQALVDAATQLSGASFGAFFYNATDEEGGRYLVSTLSGTTRDAFERVPRPHDLLKPAFSGQAAVRLDDVRGRSAPHGALVPAAPVASYLAVPVAGRRGGLLGTLVLGHPEPGVFTVDAERIVVGLAAQAAIALDNARLYEAERRARGDAEAANRAKDEFLAMLGHELRNPLSAVRNAVVTARLDPSRRDRALDIARRGTEQLGRLVDDLLDVARITQGRIVLRKQHQSLAGIVEGALETTRSLIDERAHALSVSLPGADVQVDADATRLEQVIANLITNAAKYTDPGGRIRISAVHENGEAILCIRDNGIGIAREMLPRVFDLFAQADRGLDRAEGGLGIGLTLVRRLVELHGGRVEARSDGLGEGAEFVVRLPAFVASRDHAGSATGAVGIDRPRARVLLVEDNEDAADSLMMLLELLGHRVRVAHDGPSALDLAHANPPDVMLVDIGLPGMNGYEVARRMRADAALRETVLVALTGYGREEDREQALAAGFDHHLVKPVNPDALEGLVAQLPAAPRATVH